MLAVDSLMSGCGTSATAHHRTNRSAAESRLSFRHSRATGKEQAGGDNRHVFLIPHLAPPQNVVAQNWPQPN
jgi:hypothetical protein